MPIKGLILDAYGTLYDVHSVQAKTEQLCPGKGDLITQSGGSSSLNIRSCRRRCRAFAILTS
jgi:hypothetical protein